MNIITNLKSIRLIEIFFLLSILFVPLILSKVTSSITDYSSKGNKVVIYRTDFHQIETLEKELAERLVKESGGIWQ